MRILHINSSAPFASQVAVILEQLEAVVDTAPSIDTAADALAVEGYDIALWDADQGTEGDVEKIKEIRTRYPGMALLVCGSCATSDRLIAAMETGAHDFILKPVRLPELRLRVGCIAAKSSNDEPPINQLGITHGPLALDMARGEVRLNGQLLELTPRERAVLSVLIRNKGGLVSKEQIASRVFSLNDEATARSIETYIHRLRRKLNEADIEINTVRGLGYRLEAGSR